MIPDSTTLTALGLQSAAALVPTPLGVLSLHPAHHGELRLPHLSAASGLVRAGRYLFVVADDELHLGVFDDTIALAEPPPWGKLVRLLEGRLPVDKVARKRAKPDFETLALLPPMPGFGGGAMLALGSGSGAHRQQGVLLALGEDSLPLGASVVVNLEALYAPLRHSFGDLNIEGAWVNGGELHLLQRGNQGDPRSACIRYLWHQLVPWLMSPAAPVPEVKSIQIIALGEAGGVPLGLTDGCALSNGHWVFSAVAEATNNSVADGACVASALGIVDAGGSVVQQWQLQGAPKVEGVAVQRQGGEWQATLVTDPDDAQIPSQWLRVCWPAALG